MCYKNFGSNVKKLRKEVKLTQEELGEKMGVSKTAIVNYENGKRKVPLDIVVGISDFFDIPIDDLLGRNPNKMTMIKDWNEEFKDIVFTKEETKQLIHYGRYLLFLRKDQNNAEIVSAE